MAKQSESSSASRPERLQRTTHDKFSTAEMLTDSEIQSLRQHAKEADDYMKKAFANLRPKTAAE
jgi:hypothetical protein